MNQQEITKGNVAIDIFYSGRELMCDDLLGRRSGSKYYNYYDVVGVEDLKYHKSWDALMPVVEKIEALGYMFSISNREAYTCRLENNTDGDFENTGASKIDATYKTVIQFIEWYNNQPQTNEQ